MISVKDIAWLAGILEGEGCFILTIPAKNPAIVLCMKDLDIVVRANRIMQCDTIVKKRVKKNNKHSDMYHFQVNTIKAVQWMMTIYPMMGMRRQAKIREILSAWKQKKYNGNYKMAPLRVAI